MLTANVSAHLAVASFTRFKVPSVDSTTESSSPGPPVLSNGAVSNHPGDALVAGLLLICLFAAALLIPFERLIPQERDGNKSSPFTSTDSLKKKKPGGTEKERYDTL